LRTLRLRQTHRLKQMRLLQRPSYLLNKRPRRPHGLPQRRSHVRLPRRRLGDSRKKRLSA
jgi:hypothetical protein